MTMTALSTEELSDDLMERIALRLKAMGNPVRLKILHGLEEGELSVSEITDRVGGSQANVSKQLQVLRSADLVSSRRDGVNVYYRIRDGAIFAICETVCDSILHQASAEVERIERARRAIRGVGR